MKLGTQSHYRLIPEVKRLRHILEDQKGCRLRLQCHRLQVPWPSLSLCSLLEVVKAKVWTTRWHFIHDNTDTQDSKRRTLAFAFPFPFDSLIAGTST